MIPERRLAILFPALILCILLTVGRSASASEPAQEGKTYSPEAVREDFATLYRNLEASAYDLFIHTDKTEFDAEYERLLGTITGPMTALEASRLFQSFVVLARISHCTIQFPVEAFQEWYRSGGRFFPFDLTFDGKRAFIVFDWSQTDGIDGGDEPLTVHGMNIDEFMERLFRLVPGENDYAKRALLEVGGIWPQYWYSFGGFGAGPVRIRKKNGRVVELEVSGIDIERYRALRDSATGLELTKEGREFRFIEDIAYLRPGTFLNLSSNDLSEQETFDKTEFISFIDSVFTVIAATKPDNLILDLRGNTGGSNTFSDPMIAYLADRPFREASSIHFRTSRITKEFWRDFDDPAAADLKHQIMTREDGERWSEEGGFTQPRSDSLRFEGSVFALIDRFSLSQAAVVASVIQDFGFGTLIGEETSYIPSSCAAVHTFDLPHTQMQVVYPKACGVRPNGDESPHGVIPDREVKEDYFSEGDEILQAALEIIRESGGD
jgi:hypothetical protein